LLAQNGLAFICIHAGGNFLDAAAFREKTLPAAQAAGECAAGAAGIVVSSAGKPGPEPGTHGRKIAEELRLQAGLLAELARLYRSNSGAGDP